MADRKADLFWSLPLIVNYRAGAKFPVAVSVVNLLNKRREYGLRMRTYDRAGRRISEAVFRVHGLAWFEVEGGERETFDGAFSVEESDVALEAVLIDRESQEELDRVSVWLQSY